MINCSFHRNKHVSMFWNLSIHLLKNTIILREWLSCVLVYYTRVTWRSLIGCFQLDQSDLPRLLPRDERPPLLVFRRSMRGWAARSTDNQTLINRMMLRFRPIAPKPAGEEAAEKKRTETDLPGRRVKRKYVRIRGRQSNRPRRQKSKVVEGGKRPSPQEKSCVEDAPPPEEGSVTLQLLEVRSESEGKICDISVPENWRAVRSGVNMSTAVYGGGATDLRGGGSVIETWIIMESVTDKFTGVVGLGFSDKEKIYHLERDTCPGFVSDSTNNVIWVNPAYKKMVAEDEETAVGKGFLVRLVVKEELPHLYPSFACRVRVTQQKLQGQKWNRIVPCDVWRMEFSGFAWKLDVNTALGLGF